MRFSIQEKIRSSRIPFSMRIVARYWTLFFVDIILIIPDNGQQAFCLVFGFVPFALGHWTGCDAPSNIYNGTIIQYFHTADIYKQPQFISHLPIAQKSATYFPLVFFIVQYIVFCRLFRKTANGRSGMYCGNKWYKLFIYFIAGKLKDGFKMGDITRVFGKQPAWKLVFDLK